MYNPPVSPGMKAALGHFLLDHPSYVETNVQARQAVLGAAQFALSRT